MKLTVAILTLLITITTTSCFVNELSRIVTSSNQVEIACEGRSLNLMCMNNEGIKVKSAFWGRDNANICPPLDNKKSSTVHCKPSCFFYPLAKLIQFCDGRQFCNLRATELFFERPLCCPKVKKFLRVVYDCHRMTGL